MRPPFRESLEDLGEQLDRDPELGGDPLHADRGVALVLGDVLHRHEPVVDLLREPQHFGPLTSPTTLHATPE
jgi:hypothetical protein